MKMATDTKASALRAVWHYWQHLDDEEMKPLVVNLASNEGYRPQEIADAAGTTVEIIEPIIAARSQTTKT